MLNQKRFNQTFFSPVQTFGLNYTLLFRTLKIEETRRLNFVSFSRLQNSETKLRIETKLSGDSIQIVPNPRIVLGMIPLPDQIALSSQKPVEHRPYVHLRDQDNATANSFKVTRLFGELKPSV